MMPWVAAALTAFPSQPCCTCGLYEDMGGRRKPSGDVIVEAKREHEATRLDDLSDTLASALRSGSDASGRLF